MVEDGFVIIGAWGAEVEVSQAQVVVAQYLHEHDAFIVLALVQPLPPKWAIFPRPAGAVNCTDETRESQPPIPSLNILHLVLRRHPQPLLSEILIDRDSQALHAEHDGTLRQSGMLE